MYLSNRYAFYNVHKLYYLDSTLDPLSYTCTPPLIMMQLYNMSFRCRLLRIVQEGIDVPGFHDFHKIALHSRLRRRVIQVLHQTFFSRDVDGVIGTVFFSDLILVLCLALGLKINKCVGIQCLTRRTMGVCNVNIQYLESHHPWE